MNYMEQVAHMLGVELDEEFCIKGNDNKFKITKYGMCVFSEFSAVWDFANDILVGILTEHYEIKKPILTDKEKEYLCNVIKPLDIQVTEMRKVNYDDEWEQLIIEYENKLGEPYKIVMPIFDKGTMYKGMKTNIVYAPEELGL